MTRVPRNYWTKERCEEAALKCDSIGEFREIHKSAYSTAHQRGWINEITQSLARRHVPKGTFTKERCAELALQCSTRIEFKKKSPSAYRACVKLGWLQEVCGHMPERVVPKYKWTDEKVAEVLARYTDAASFAREQTALRSVLLSRGDYITRTAHFSRQKGKPLIWSKEACAREARGYSSRSAFKAYSPSAYASAAKHGWMEEIIGHMKRRSGNAMRSVYAIRRKGTKQIYIGLSYNPASRYAGHMQKATKKVRELLNSPHTFRLITKPMDADEAAVVEQKFIAHFRAKGWEVFNVSKGGGLGGVRRKWSLETLQHLADQCTSRLDMVRRFPTAFRTATHMGLLKTIFAHHANAGYAKKRR